MGRISPEKGVDHAIEIARRAGLPLKVAAKVDDADRLYFEDAIRPLLAGAGVEFLGEVGEEEKGALLRGARALLFPIDWPEPFGLVMIEALACATPVIAFERGAAREVLADPRAGFLCQGREEAVAAVARLPELPRHGCRELFEERFTAARMTRDYLRIYAGLLGGTSTDADDADGADEARERRRHGAARERAGAVLHPRDRGTAG